MIGHHFTEVGNKVSYILDVSLLSILTKILAVLIGNGRSMQVIYEVNDVVNHVASFGVSFWVIAVLLTKLSENCVGLIVLFSVFYPDRKLTVNEFASGLTLAESLEIYYFICEV